MSRVFCFVGMLKCIKGAPVIQRFVDSFQKTKSICTLTPFACKFDNHLSYSWYRQMWKQRHKMPLSVTWISQLFTAETVNKIIKNRMPTKICSSKTQCLRFWFTRRKKVQDCRSSIFCTCAVVKTLNFAHFDRYVEHFWAGVTAVVCSKRMYANYANVCKCIYLVPLNLFFCEF